MQAPPWSKLNSHFLQSLGPVAKAHIFELSTQIAAELTTWSAQYPLMRPVRILPLSLSIAASAPFADVRTLSAVARVNLWVFALDDLFDEENLPELELLRQAEIFHCICHGQPASPDTGSLAAALTAIRADLAAYPLFEPLQAEWTGAMCGTLDEMIREARWRQQYRREGTAMLPSYEAYLDCGRYSIGGPPHIWSTIIGIDDPSTINYLPELRQMERISSLCIRLANDLQSYEKELVEGKINSLLILSHRFQQQGVEEAGALRQAEMTVRADIARGLTQLTRLQSAATTDSGKPEAAMADIARFACEFYTRHDFHTFAG